MNRRNYARELDRIIERRGNTIPRVLLHACCGVCSSSVLEYLTKYFDVTILWYNPNIFPEAEFNKRFGALVDLLGKMNLTEKVSILAEPWNHDAYLKRIEGLENEPEGGKRCTECFRLRLLECARLAKLYGYDYFCTTLTLSRHKDAVLLNSIGEEMSDAFAVKWLPSDFKKRNGENRAMKLSDELGIYKQLYCGCEFSYSIRQEGTSKKAPLKHVNAFLK